MLSRPLVHPPFIASASKCRSWSDNLDLMSFSTRGSSMLSRIVFAAAGLIALTAAASAKPVTLSTETNLRAAPGTKSDIVTAMPKGAAVEVGDCDAGWCKVTFDGKEGFAIGRNLGESAPRAATAARSQPDMQKLRRAYENYFEGEGRNDRAADMPAQPRRYSQQAVPQDGYYDDDGPPVGDGAPASA